MTVFPAVVVGEHLLTATSSEEADTALTVTAAGTSSRPCSNKGPERSKFEKGEELILETMGNPNKMAHGVKNLIFAHNHVNCKSWKCFLG